MNSTSIPKSIQNFKQVFIVLTIDTVSYTHLTLPTKLL